AYMSKNATEYFEYEFKARTPIYDTETKNLFDLLNKNNYEKGSWVLHALRGTLGDEVFFKGLRIYYHAHEGSTATTEDLRAAMEKASGRDLKEFFTRWVYQSGHPVYKISWRQITPKTVEVRLAQTQSDEAFLTPVTLRFVIGKNSRDLVM